MSTIDRLPAAMPPHAGPWDCDAHSTMYSMDGDELAMIEVRANVTEAGWNSVAFIAAIWPGADIHARLIAAAPDLLEAIPPLIALAHRLLPEHAQADGTFDNLAEIIQARAAIAKSLLPHINHPERSHPMRNAIPSSPIVVVTVRGGIVMEARANCPLTVIVEDWDCTDQAAPVTLDLEPTVLTEAEEQHFLRRFNLSNKGA